MACPFPCQVEEFRNKLDSTAQVRATIYPARIAFVEELMGDGKVDPIVVARDNFGYVPIDGSHRRLSILSTDA